VLALLRAVGPLDSNYNPGSIFDPDEHDFNPADFGPGQPIYPASDQFKPSNFQDFDLIDLTVHIQIPVMAGAAARPARLVTAV